MVTHPRDLSFWEEVGREFKASEGYQRYCPSKQQNHRGPCNTLAKVTEWLGSQQDRYESACSLTFCYLRISHPRSFQLRKPPIPAFVWDQKRVQDRSRLKSSSRLGWSVQRREGEGGGEQTTWSSVFLLRKCWHEHTHTSAHWLCSSFILLPEKIWGMS